MFTDRYSDALAFTHDLHRTQTRKSVQVPYISHLLAVSSLVTEAGGTEDQAIGALLHDAAEDQGGRQTLEVIRCRFGQSVAQIVSDCTDAWAEPKPAWKPRKIAFIASLPAKADRSLLVSLADKAHNAEAIRSDFDTLGEAAFDRFTGAADGTRWYYRTLAEFFTNRLPGPLSMRLGRAVTGFEA